jgi:ADP-ribosyl-[dinitrogen reductase] hydrolase
VSEEGDFSAAELTPLRALRARYQGGLHGLAACDALAAATQFRRAGSFAPVGDVLGGGPFDLPRGGWSDDTAMALCLAESLLARGGCDVADQRERYGRWQAQGYLSATGQCLGITAATAQALAGGPAGEAGSAPGEALARLLPVVLLAWPQPGPMQQWAVDSARVTTGSRITLDAARVLAHMLQAALLGAPPARIVGHEPGRYAGDPLCAPVAQLACSPALERPAPQGSQALDVLALARWCFASTSSFRAGALQAANLGGDADMVCAVFGQLAGLHYGFEAIPRGWRQVLSHAEQITDLADGLLRDALLALDGQTRDAAAGAAAAAVHAAPTPPAAVRRALRGRR